MGRVIWVSPDNGKWKVHWEGGATISHHFLKSTAIRAARRKVSQRPEGSVRQIKIQRADGRIQIEWTYGRDPYPPEG